MRRPEALWLMETQEVGNGSIKTALSAAGSASLCGTTFAAPGVLASEMEAETLSW